MSLKREILMVNCADMNQPTPDNSWGSTGALSCGKRFENVVGIRLLKHNFVGTALIYVPEWAPHCVGCYAYKPEITVKQGTVSNAIGYVTHRINQRIPEYLVPNNNYYVMSNSRTVTGAQEYLSPSEDNILVAEVNSRETPFSFDRVSHAIWILSSNDNLGLWGYSGNFQYTHTYFQNITADIIDAPIYLQPGWNNSVYTNNRSNGNILTTENQPIGTSPPFFVYEIIMVDETSHIARMPNADQLAIEYQDKVEQTGRYKSNASEINKAISAFKSFSK